VVAKDRALEVAASLGIRTPRTCAPTTSDTARLGCDIHLPVVLKWPDPNAVQPLLSGAGLAVDKARYCLSEQELRQYLAQYDAVGQYPLVQEYCRGVGLGHFIYMHNGKALRTFQHLRLREWPPEGGTSTACLSLDPRAHAALLEKSIALLATLDWEGVAMVEYRYDAASGEAVFMEVNGRFWGSFPLAVASGAQFAWLQYNVMGLGRQPSLGKTRSGLRCRFMLPEIRRLFRVVMQPGRIRDPNFDAQPIAELWTFLRDFFRWRSCYFVFASDDPGPFFSDLRTLIGKLLSRSSS
jgi:predicted ATP-grasp superfamily ATP-dependent carboligase